MDDRELAAYFAAHAPDLIHFDDMEPGDEEIIATWAWHYSDAMMAEYRKRHPPRDPHRSLSKLLREVGRVSAAIRDLKDSQVTVQPYMERIHRAMRHQQEEE